MKNKSINNNNYLDDINPQTAIFGANNDIANQTNEIQNNINNNNELNNISFDDEININTESKEEKYKNKNNLINLNKKTSNELLEIALKKNEKMKKKHVNNNNINNYDLPSFAKNFPVSIFQVYQYNNENLEKTCSICLDKFIIGKKYITLPCFHFFHVKCISDWLKKERNCPLCKTKID